MPSALMVSAEEDRKEKPVAYPTIATAENAKNIVIAFFIIIEF